MNKNLIYIGVVVVATAVVGGVVLMLGKQSGPTVQDNPTDMVTEETPEEKKMAGPTVEIKDFAFSPTTITIKKGETVTWINKDVTGHSATADDKSFDTGVLAQGEEGSVKFETTGTFSYHCTPHPNMKATVVVTE